MLDSLGLNIVDHLECLGGRQERIIYMLYWEGLTEDEIATRHNCHVRTVIRALESARKKIQEKCLSGVTFSWPQTVVHMQGKENSGTQGRGNGLSTTTNPDNGPGTAYGTNRANQDRPGSLERTAVSLNPPTDIYESFPMARERFIEDLGNVCDSAFLQLMNCGGYNEHALANRERIARDRGKGFASRAT